MKEEKCTCNHCECEEENRDDMNKNEECDSQCECHDKKHKKNKKEDKQSDKIKELEDSLLRSKADFINYRKRLEEEQSRLLKFCNEDLIKELLPILDNFERAIYMDDENLTDEVSKFLSGFKMIYCNFVSILQNSGVMEIDGINKPFDPTYHEAILTELRDGVDSGMVLEVMRKGYILKGKVIRPAMVKVSE